MKLKEKYEKLLALVKRMRKERYHFPDSDSREYCADCQRSPYNVPPHTDDCLVVHIHKTLKEVEQKNHDT